MIEGAVVTFTEMTEMKAAQTALREAEALRCMAAVVRDANGAVLVLTRGSGFNLNACSIDAMCMATSRFARSSEPGSGTYHPAQDVQMPDQSIVANWTRAPSKRVANSLVTLNSRR